MTLLTSNLTCHRAVNLVGQPVLTCHSLKSEHILYITIKCIREVLLARLVIYSWCIVSFNGLVVHHRNRRVTEHLCHVEVEWLNAVALTEREVCIARSLTHHIQRGTLAFGNAAHMFDMLLVDEKSHALLTLVCYYLLCRKCFVSDRQFCHVYLATALLNKF